MIHFSARLPDIALRNIKIGAHVLDAGGFVIVNGDTLHSSQNDVLRYAITLPFSKSPISTPRPFIPTMRALEHVIFFIASSPRT